MDRAKLFQTGRSQAVRLPKAYRFEGDEVIVRHVGNCVLLVPANDAWSVLETALEMFEPGLQLDRDQPVEQAREELLP